MRDKELLTLDAEKVRAEVKELAMQIAEYSAADGSVEAGADSPYADM